MVKVIDKGLAPADHPIYQEPWTVTPGRAGSPNESADDLDDGDGEPTDESWQHEQAPTERARFVQVFAGDPTWSYDYDHSFSGLVTIGDLFSGYGHIQREIPWADLTKGLAGVRTPPNPGAELAYKDAFGLFESVAFEERYWDGGGPGLSGYSYYAFVPEEEFEATARVVEELAGRLEEWYEDAEATDVDAHIFLAATPGETSEDTGIRSDTDDRVPREEEE